MTIPVTGAAAEEARSVSAGAALDPGDTGYDAVILAGGRARRMGGADKPGARIGGVSLLARVARAVYGADRVVVVGPERPERMGTMTVREDPPGAGPVPALRAGLALVRAPWVAVLAADLPFLESGHLAALRAEAKVGGTGAILCDRSGHPQWLAGVWRTARLRTALDAYGGSSLKGLLGPLDAARLSLDDPVRPPWYDCDTEEELSRARGALGPARTETTVRPRKEPVTTMLDQWTAQVCRELGLRPDEVDRDLILDLARDVAHGVARPAAPLTAYLLGLAVGRGAPAAETAARISGLAAGGPAGPGERTGRGG